MDVTKHNSSHFHNIFNNFNNNFNNYTNRLTISSVVSGKSRIAIFTLNQHGGNIQLIILRKT